MKKIKRRGAVYGVIALMLCAAVYLNWSYVGQPQELLDAVGGGTQQAAQSVGTTEKEDYFSASRLSREQARDEAISILKETVDSTDTDAAAKEQANAQISVLADQTVAEARMERLICAKGYTDAVVMIGGEGVNVVIAPPEGGLDAQDTSVIRDIVMEQAQVTAAQIKIVEAA